MDADHIEAPLLQQQSAHRAVHAPGNGTSDAANFGISLGLNFKQI